MLGYPIVLKAKLDRGTDQDRGQRNPRLSRGGLNQDLPRKNLRTPGHKEQGRQTLMRSSSVIRVRPERHFHPGVTLGSSQQDLTIPKIDPSLRLRHRVHRTAAYTQLIKSKRPPVFFNTALLDRLPLVKAADTAAVTCHLV
jgi:hypothetical protein